MNLIENLAAVYIKETGGAIMHGGLSAMIDYLSAQGLLVEPFDPENWDGQTEPPEGWRVCDRDGDVWLHGPLGWGLKDGGDWNDTVAWDDFPPCAPFVLVPGGYVPPEDRK